ncbi:YmfQ family protein [Caulobacter soli]|uniref:YmfQ family protein n=1 Tax=Caulobacter soli TaxID=2708539 RepID=UPI0013EDAC57|nr:putative phage tail protein [Caulobacter soli]
MRSAASYLTQLQALLPLGAAWNRSPDSVMTAALGAFAEELARIDQRAADLVEEADPRTATELLTEWERLVGLPDGCTPIAATIEERRLAVYQRLAGLGGQNAAYFVALAERLGYAAEVRECFPAMIGDHIGDRLFGEAWAWVWILRTSPALGDDPLGLQCVVRRLKPAHTVVMFGEIGDDAF